MMGIANPHTQLQRITNPLEREPADCKSAGTKTEKMNAVSHWRHSSYSRKICVRFASFTLRLHQSCSTKDGRVVVGQFGNANINAAVVNEAQMLLE